MSCNSAMKGPRSQQEKKLQKCVKRGLWWCEQNMAVEKAKKVVLFPARAGGSPFIQLLLRIYNILVFVRVVSWWWSNSFYFVRILSICLCLALSQHPVLFIIFLFLTNELLWFKNLLYCSKRNCLKMYNITCKKRWSSLICAGFELNLKK